VRILHLIQDQQEGRDWLVAKEAIEREYLWLCHPGRHSLGIRAGRDAQQFVSVHFPQGDPTRSGSVHNPVQHRRWMPAASQEDGLNRPGSQRFQHGVPAPDPVAHGPSSATARALIASR
jgi:hypothetical protein